MLQKTNNLYSIITLSLFTLICLFSVIDPGFAANNPFEKITSKMGEIEGFIRDFIFAGFGLAFVATGILCMIRGKIYWNYLAILLIVTVGAGIYPQIKQWIMG